MAKKVSRNYGKLIGFKKLSKNATQIHNDVTYKYSFPLIFGQILYFWMLVTTKEKLILYNQCKPNTNSFSKTSTQVQSTGEKGLLMVFKFYFQFQNNKGLVNKKRGDFYDTLP